MSGYWPAPCGAGLNPCPCHQCCSINEAANFTQMCAEPVGHKGPHEDESGEVWPR